MLKRKQLNSLKNSCICSHNAESSPYLGAHMNADNIIARPDLSKRPLRITAEMDLTVSPQEAF